MPTTFLVSDTHFGHRGVCKFLKADGTKLRPWDNPNDMDEAMVALWNDTVKPNDKVYHLGDVVINRRALPTLARLNGDKVLIKGNHDIFKLNEYLPYFRDIRAYHVMDNLIMSHIPVHRGQSPRFRGNVHGHLHSNKLDDPWYLCVCVEQTNFKPISFDHVREQILKANSA
jgi:calcineurin-like phosphoesterase family protein